MRRSAPFVVMCVGVPVLLAGFVVRYHALLAQIGITGTVLLVCTALAVMPGLMLVFGTFTWIFGIATLRRRRRLPSLHWPPEGAVVDVSRRVALVCPIKNEDTAAVFANLQAIYESLRDAGAGDLFDTFVISNSDDPNCWIEEELAWAQLSAEVSRAYLWRRHRKTGRKIANITEFCERWGSNYTYMVVLDADSLMSGECLLALVRLMECNPRAGILQVPCRLVNGQTLFARLQQYSTFRVGIVTQLGDRAWQGRAGPYFGHNAMIRVSAFMAHCGLPKLSGKPPRGGEILSHDFVEATLMARAGWDVWVLPELGGSYEECPPTLYLHARRDRRWCQGDLQNLRLIRAPSLALANRVRFLLASVRNLTSLGVLVLTGLIVGFADPTGQRTCVAAPSSADACLPGIGTMLAVVLPFVIWDLATRMSWAGAPAVGLGLRWAATAADRARPSVVSTVVSEVFGNLLWLITAPDRLMGRTMFVLGFASGRDAGWASLRRLSVQQPVLTAGATSAVRQSLAAVAVVSVLLVVAPWAVWWAAPFLLLWVATAGTTRVLDSERAGRAARRMGLLPTPEEASIPPVVARAGDLRVVFGDALPQSGTAWPVALTEPAAIVLHRAFVAHLAPLTPHDRAAADAAAHKYRAGGCLTSVEAMALLHAPELVVPALDESVAGNSRTRPADGVAHVVVAFPESTWTPMPQRPPWLGSQGRERFAPRPDMCPEIPFPATTHSDPSKNSTGSRNDPFRHEALPTDVE